MNDESIIERLYTFKQNETSDWYENLPKAAKKSIAQGLKEAKEGKVIPHDIVMEEIRNKYNIKK